jgi:hypothetical protein
VLETEHIDTVMHFAAQVREMRRRAGLCRRGDGRRATAH